MRDPRLELELASRRDWRRKFWQKIFSVHANKQYYFTQTVVFSRGTKRYVVRPRKAAKNDAWRLKVRQLSHRVALERTEITSKMAKRQSILGLPSRGQGYKVEKPLREELFRQKMLQEERKSKLAWRKVTTAITFINESLTFSFFIFRRRSKLV